MNYINDTIASIATPLGTGGVAVIRISGEKVFDMISKIFSLSLRTKKIPDFEANKVYYGWIISNGRPIDQVLLLSFRCPKSFTGEDVIEIHCHGGVNVTKNILQLCLKSGARLATRGEFSKRAFLNGKMGLTEAEAILDIIHSRTDKFSQVSAYNLSGKLSFYIKEIRNGVMKLLSDVIAALDFSEEVDEPNYSFLEESINNIINRINIILKSSKNSNLMRQGLKIAIAGKPNVGKSSLFNSLLDMDRAIVTNIPGTTRDTIQESLDVDGIPVTLIDTAGIRELDNKTQSDQIESIGINIAKDHIQNSDIVLFLYNLTEGMEKEDCDIFFEIKNKPVIKIGSKVDLVNNLNELSSLDKPDCLISTKTGDGIDIIKQKIKQFVLSANDVDNSEYSTNIRHQECLNKAKESLLLAATSCQNYEPQDFVSIDLKSALLSLDEITGEVVTEEILDNIFSNFCIGK